MQNINFKNPFPMGRMSYPTSDTELETWVEQNIQSEISRGMLLQDEKFLAAERLNNAGVFNKPPRLAGSFDRRSSMPKWNSKRRSRSPIARSARASIAESRDSRDGGSSAYSYKSPRLGRPACSMRISELAVPTKRQCMASWRANAKTLPAPMVNRLKQRVLDQEPIVKVSDAVNCLKRKRQPSDWRNSVVITPVKRSSRKINRDAMVSRIEAEHRVFSEVFGTKIAELLMKPMSITLNSQLQNLSNIISEEIYTVIKDTKVFKTDKATNMRMVQDVSEKVTIWIAKILEDSKEKLLEEDLKASAIPAGELITLIEVITLQERDLEEQEGPVLDILDEIVDSILHKCMPTPSDILTPEYLSVTSVDVDKDDQLDIDLQTPNEEAPKGDEITEGEAANADTISTDMINQLNTIIDSIDQKDTLETSVKQSNDGTAFEDYNENNFEELDTQSEFETKPELDKRESDIKLETNFKLEPDVQPEPDVKPEPDVQPEQDVQAESDVKSESEVKPEPDVNVLYSNDTEVMSGEYNEDEPNNNNTDEDVQELNSVLQSTHETTEIPTMQNQEMGDETLEEYVPFAPEENNILIVNEEPPSNVSGAIEIINGELSEEQDKKVQFSKENLDPLNEIQQNNPLDGENLHLRDDQPLGNIADFEKPHIEFAPRNDELLSDADESWPEKISSAKPSASVTRSITSMGKLLETDETYSTVLEDNTTYYDQSPQTKDKKKNLEANKNEKDLLEDLKDNTTTNKDFLEITDSQYDPEDLAHLHEIEQNVHHESLMESAILKITDDRLESPVRKHESVIVIADVDLHDSRDTMDTYKRQISDTVSMGELDASKYDQFKNGERFDEGIFRDHIDQRCSSAEEFPSLKFDYRVHLQTAPAWIKRGQGEPNGSPCVCKPVVYDSGTDRMKERELEMLKWCRDLDFILMNLDKWKNWLNYISKYITDLKRKAGQIDENQPFRPATDGEASCRKLHKHARGGLEVGRQDETVNFRISPTPGKCCVSCGRTKPNQFRKRHVRSHSGNNAVAWCKKHHKQEYDANLRKN